MSHTERETPAWRLAPVTALVVVASGVLWFLLPYGVAPQSSGAVPHWLLLVLLAIGFVLSEFNQAHVEVRKLTLSVSMSEVPLVLGLFLVDAPELLALRLAAAVFVAVLRRTAVYKAVFNLALFSAEVITAAAVFTAVRGSAATGPFSWLAAYAATTSAAALTGGLVYAAIVRLQGSIARRDVVAMLLPLIAGALLPTTGALLAVVVGQADARAVPLFLALVALTIFAYRGYSRLLRRYRTIGQVSDYTAALSHGGTVEELSGLLLEHARTLLTAESAEVVLASTAGGVALALRQDGTSTTAVTPSADGPREHVLTSGEAVLAPRGTHDPELSAWLRHAGLRDALVVPLRRPDATIIGTLQVGQRMGEMGTFGSAERDLLQMVASHFEVAVRSQDLLDQLSFDAHHDPLTGLANRTLFRQRVDDAMTDRRHDQAYAVLMLDLDGFKDVNDTLGHASGDLLLQEVAGRLRRSMPEGVTVARLGGDEFALLVPVSDDPDDMMVVAQLVQRALRASFMIHEVDLEIRASIGVARCPEHATDGALLLQRADVAMYAAKQARQSIQVYNPEIDRANPRRLALVGELRTAIDEHQLLCHYQPQVALDGRTVLGVEALVRWRHPTLGMVSPDDFIPIAEHTGLIVPLTTLVLRTALQDCARWRAAGHDLNVAVNVSPRGLLAPDFVREVATLLAQTGMPASALTLEVTESSVMTDPVKATAVLASLHDLGIDLSVDDFGTGYSSLAYLQRLPVDEVKIDKSFVLDLATEKGNVAIVRAIVDLGHNLGLRVVAEGVEDQRSMDILASLGCDTAQGYLVSRPLPTEVFEQWLAAPTHGPSPIIAALPRPRLVILG